MKLYLRSVTKKSNCVKKVKRILIDSFPKREQIPFSFLMLKAKSDFIDFLAIYDDNVLVGFTYLVTNEDLTFVLYLAIDRNIRSKGYGKMALDAIKEKHPGNRIILNIEAISSTSNNNEQRIKRKKFYVKNGFHNASLFLIDQGDIYEVLISHGDSTAEEYRRIYKKLAGPLLYWLFKPSVLPFQNSHE